MSTPLVVPWMNRWSQSSSPREGFGPGRAGAIGLLARRQMATPGFRTVIIGGPQPGPVFPDVAFEPVQPSLLWPGNINLRFAQAASRMLRRMSPALIEVHNRPEIALRLARRLPHVPVTLLLHNDPQSMRAARTPAERAILLRRMALVMTSSGYLRDRLLDGLEAPPGSVAVQPNCIDLAELPEPRPRERLILFAGRVVPDKGPDMFVAACIGHAATARMARGDHRRGPFQRNQPLDRVRPQRAEGGSGCGRHHGRLPRSPARSGGQRPRIDRRGTQPVARAVRPDCIGGARERGRVDHIGRGGLREVAGDAAVYVDPDSPASIADAILRLAKDASLREALGAAGRERARRFDVSVAAERIAALRRQVLAGR